MTKARRDYGRYSHPYIVAYDRQIGSNDSYIQDQLKHARQRNAPKDAWTCYYDEDPRLARNLTKANFLRDWLVMETGIEIETLAAQ